MSAGGDRATDGGAKDDGSAKEHTNWWETDPALSSKARRDELARKNTELRERPARLEPGRAQKEAP